MSDQTQQPQEKAAKDGKAALARVQGQIKDAKRKAFEAQLKSKAEALNAAEVVVRNLQTEIENMITDNEALYQ